MTDLSIAVLTAWQIAAIETAAAKHQYIEGEQIFIGICSLEKILSSTKFNLNLNYTNLQEIKNEHDSINRLFNNFKLNITSLRREIRKRFGQGNYKHENRVIHRSKKCKVFFDQAEILAQNYDEISCLHLLSALLENSKGTIKEILVDRKIIPEQVYKKALLYARVGLQGRNNDSYII